MASSSSSSQLQSPSPPLTPSSSYNVKDDIIMSMGPNEKLYREQYHDVVIHILHQKHGADQSVNNFDLGIDIDVQISNLYSTLQQDGLNDALSRIL